MTILEPDPNLQQICVFDDVRNFRQNPADTWVTYCRTNDEFIAYLDTNPKIDILFLDHDLGGKVYQDDDEGDHSRRGAIEYLTRIQDGRMKAPDFISIITMNPVGQKLFIHMFQEICPIEINPGGVKHDMIGW